MRAWALRDAQPRQRQAAFLAGWAPSSGRSCAVDNNCGAAAARRAAAGVSGNGVTGQTMVATTKRRARSRRTPALRAAWRQRIVRQLPVVRLERLLRVRRALASDAYDVDRRLSAVAGQLVREIGCGGTRADRAEEDWLRRVGRRAGSCEGPLLRMR